MFWHVIIHTTQAGMMTEGAIPEFSNIDDIRRSLGVAVENTTSKYLLFAAFFRSSLTAAAAPSITAAL